MWAWTIGGAGLVLAHRVGRRQAYLEIGSIVLAITMCRWVIELLQTRLAMDWTPTTMPFLNEVSLLGLLAIAGAVWAIRTLHRVLNTEFARGLSGFVASIAIVGILFKRRAPHRDPRSERSADHLGWPDSADHLADTRGRRMRCDPDAAGPLA